MTAIEVEPMTKPTIKPQNPCFSSGPCAKRPGWSLAALADAALGRSHRATLGRAKLQEVIERSRAILGVPDDYRIGVVPASDTGAVEMCLWSLLGVRGVDVLSWESFSQGWVTDITKHLQIEDTRVFSADFGQLPDLDQVDCDRDVVFAWNGTTSGVRVPDSKWIAEDREGLTICDATSAVFAMELPWDKLDVTTITPELLASLNELGGSEANVATGYHAIEFLLWGQDMHGFEAGAGERPATDFAKGDACTADNCDRRGAYLLADRLVGETVAVLVHQDAVGKTRFIVCDTPVERPSVVFLPRNDVKQVLLELGLYANGRTYLAGQDHRVAVHAGRQQGLGGLKFAGPPGQCFISDVAAGG